MDKTTAILTGFIVACISIIVYFAIINMGSDSQSAASVINSYMTGAFGIVTGGSIALPIGYAIGKKEGTDEPKT
jgi:hypothetical protein